MFRWARYIDHGVGGGVFWLWKGIYVWLWHPLAATLLRAELLLFLEGLVQHVLVHVVGPLTLQQLLLWIVLLEYMDKREDCVTVLCGHKISLYTGRPSGQRTEDCPPSRCSGTQSCPDASSSPDATLF